MKNHQTRKIIRQLAVFVLPMTALTFIQSALGAEVNCAEIENDIARLQCYDEKAGQNSNSNNSTPVVTSQPETVTIIPSDQDSDTTVTTTTQEPVVRERVVERIIYRDEPPSLPEEIRSTIVDISDSISGRKIFLLENGELWQETREYGLQIELGTNVVLRKGFFTAYNMEAGRNTIRVARYNP